MNEKTLKSEMVYKGKIIDVRVDEVLLQNKKRAYREIVEHPGAVAIIPYLPDGRIILVRQFRKPIERALLEIPAGKLNKGEDIGLCAHRELREETGYGTNNLKKLLSYYSSPGFSNEIIHIFRADDLKATSDFSPDEDEFLELVKLHPQEVQRLIKEGEIKDGKTIMALLMEVIFGGEAGI